MLMRAPGVLIVLCAVSLLLTLPAPSRNASAASPVLTARIEPGRPGWADGSLTNLRGVGGSLALDRDASFERNGQSFGVFVSSVRLAADGFDLVTASVGRDALDQGEVEIEVRSSPDGVTWSTWVPVGDGEPGGVPFGRFFQYRAELRAGPGQSPVLQALDFQLSSSGSPAEAGGTSDNPTIRLFATREGLVGRRTANGHGIGERDRFVALPSHRVLNPRDKDDYQVRIAYRGRSVAAPVWDVGPWNIKDNYWDDKRDLFLDLPRFTPQAFAAWRDDYNGGRDQYNRWVTIPASIDLADGTFLDDLGMTVSDWVDVTFLFVRAPSPERAEMPAVLGLKPERKSPVAPDDGQTWYFAEGNSTPPFETYFTLFNPGDQPVQAELTYMKVDGSSVSQTVVVKEGSRLVVSANQTVPNSEFGLRIDANRPLFAERSMYFGRDGHSSTGATAPSTTWYLAEGSTNPPFDTWILLQNPGSKPATVNLTFMKENGDNQVSQMLVPPMSRKDVRTNTIVQKSGFATKIVSDEPIVAERSIYLERGGGHNSLAAASTSKVWYFAEGSTESSVNTWLLIQNPNRTASDANVTFLREDGPPVSKSVSIGATSRLALDTREIVGSERFGVVVEGVQQIVAERAMYFGGRGDGQDTGASDSLGAVTLARSWYLPDGGTLAPYREWILVANPGDQGGSVTIEFTQSDGDPVRREFDIGARARLSIDVGEIIPNARVSAAVSATQPVVVERSSYFANGAGGTNSMGIAR